MRLRIGASSISRFCSYQPGARVDWHHEQLPADSFTLGATVDPGTRGRRPPHELADYRARALGFTPATHPSYPRIK